MALAQVPPGAVALSFDKPVPLSVSSVPVVYHGDKLAIVSLSEASFVREDLRFDLTGLGTKEVPPGLYGVRWNFMPPRESLEAQVRVVTGPFLRVTVKAGVAQYNDVDYQVSCAVFDKKGLLLGAATHTEHVKYIRLGYMPTLFREIVFDFGASRGFADAAYAVFSVSDPTVPVPPDGG
jgi:hypothetical protein